MAAQGFQFMQPFDARTIDPTAFPPPPPLADYKVMIIRSEAKQTNDQSGGYLELDLLILEGQYANREVPDRLNLMNASVTTVEISKKKLSAYCHVTGQYYISSSAQLHNIPFIATIGPQKEDDRYARVYVVKDINGNIPGKPATAAPTAPLAAPGGAPGAPAQPWNVTPPAAAPAPGGWTPTPAPGMPAAPPAPSFTPPAPPAQTFPPAGWAAHPQYPGFYYKDQQVLSEADLRKMMTPPAPTPAAPTAPAAPSFPVTSTVPPPSTVGPPAGSGAGQPPWAQGGAPNPPQWAMKI